MTWLGLNALFHFNPLICVASFFKDSDNCMLFYHLQTHATIQLLICSPGALLCVLGFISAIAVSTLDKLGMRQLGLDGAIQEESRKVVRCHESLKKLSFKCFICFFQCNGRLNFLSASFSQFSQMTNLKSVCLQRIQDVKLLSLRYWLLVLTIMFFYNGIFPFIADARFA